MDAVDLFAVALNLPSPWRISQVEFKPSKESSLELHIYIAFQRGGRFPCPQEPCGKSFPAYDTAPRTWRHLNFFQYKTCIHADLPRIQCEKHGVKTVQVPWAREGSGFTLLFESRIVELSKHLPVAVIARMVEEHDTRLWRFIRHYVEKAGEVEDYAGVANIGIDETGKKGHKYITVVTDLAQRKVIFVTEGKDSTTVRRFAADFEAHSGKCEKVHLVTCDMSLGFRKGIRETFENSKTVIDKFHAIKHANEAVDKVRKAEVKQNAMLKNSKYLWLKNEANLTESRRAKKETLQKKHLKTARAYAMRVEMQEIYMQALNRDDAEKRLEKLCSRMMHSRLEPMKKFCGTLRNHWEEILHYFEHPYTNAIPEGLNSLIQNIKRRARGFRNDEYFKTMIYLGCGKLNFDISFP